MVDEPCTTRRCFDDGDGILRLLCDVVTETDEEKALDKWWLVSEGFCWTRRGGGGGKGKVKPGCCCCDTRR